MATEKQTIETVVDIAHMMYETKMVTTYEGNISIKNGDRVYITPTSFCKGRLKEEHVVILDTEGNRISNGLKPSSEYRLHLEFYRLRPDITTVLHNHSPFATAHAICRKPIQSQGYCEAIAMFDKVPVCDYGITATEAIYQGLAKYADKTDLFLLANHGFVSIHADPYTCFYQAETVEAIAKALTIAHLLGGEHPLSHSDIADLHELKMQDTGRGEVIL
jgi:L-fuculose-phosphate aldolase